MSSSWRTLWWLILPTRFVGPRPLSSRLYLLITTVILLVLLAIPTFMLGQAYRGVMRLDDPAMLTRASLSNHDSIQMVELLSQQALKNAIEQQAQTPPLPVLFVNAPPALHEAAAKALVSRGGQLADPNCTNCVVMAWKPGRGWNAHLRGKAPGDDGNMPVLLSAMAVKEGMLASRPSPGITLESAAILPAAKALLSSSIAAFSTMFLVFCCWFIVLGMSLHGYRWDLWRNAGFLEPWVMAFHSPWVLFLSQLLRHLLLAWIAFGGLLVMAYWFGVPLSWRFAMTLFCLLPVLSLFVGLWGFLATVMFRHRRGRMVARLLLSPALLLMGWGVRLFLMWGALRMEQPILAWQKIPELERAVPWALALVPVLLASCGFMAMLIQLRLGPRREGLRGGK